MCVYYQLCGMSHWITVWEAFQGQDIWKKNYYYYSASLGSYSGLEVKLLFYTTSDWLMWTVVHDQSSQLMNPGSWAVIMYVHDLGSHATSSRPTLRITTIEMKYYRMFDKILNKVCFTDDTFTIEPQYPLPQSCRSACCWLYHYLRHRSELYALLEIRPRLHLDHISCRLNADAQTRAFGALYNDTLDT